jgi:hypothetical protein
MLIAMPRGSTIDVKLRRERVKAKLLSGMYTKDIAEDEGVSKWTIDEDVRAIGLAALMERTEDTVNLAYSQFDDRVTWAIEEAKKMHEESLGGNLQALDFVVKNERQKLDVAQSLGLLEKAAEKKEVSFDLDVSPARLKEIGDYLATN